MGRQAELKALNNPKGGKRYKFSLYNQVFGLLVLKTAPSGWADDEFRMVRDMKRFGVFQKFANSELKFLKEGRDYLKNCYEGFGINADVSFTVQETTSSWVVRERFSGTVDFSTYKINRLSCDVQIKDGTFTDLVLSRADIKVDVVNNKSIDNITITPAERSDITIPEIQIGFYGLARWKAPLEDQYTNSHVVPLLVEYSSFYELTAPGQFIDSNAGAFFQNAQMDYDNVTLFVDFVVGIAPEYPTETAFKIEMKRYNDGVYVDHIIDEYINPYSAPSYHFTKFIENETISKGDYLILQLKPDYSKTIWTYSSAQLIINNTLTSIPTRTAKGIYYREAFRAIIAKLTGKDTHVESSIFNSVHNGVVLSGRSLRNSNWYNVTVPLSLNELFDSLSLFNIGMGVENGKLVIERMEHFFSNELILDVSDRINPALVEKSVIPELFANRLQFGFQNYQYDFSGGIYEFNTAANFSTVIKPVNSEFAIVAPYIAASASIFQAITEEDDEKDLKTDDEIFMLDVVDGTARTDEGFEIVKGALNSRAIFNLDYSPARTLRRWGQFLRGFLHQNLSSYIMFLTSGRNTTLETKKPDEPLIIENANIKVSDLAENIWLPEAYTVEVPLRDNDITTIMANPYGIVKVGPEMYGWILEYKSKNENRKSTFRLLRTNRAAEIPPPPVVASVTIAAVQNPIEEGTGIVLNATPTNGGDTPLYQWYVNGVFRGWETAGYFSFVPELGDTVYCVMSSSLPEVLPVNSNTITVEFLATTGMITVTKTVTDHPDDETYFHVTLTGQGEDPTVVDGYVQQGTPIVFEDLPFDTYVLTEDSVEGYAITSIGADVILTQENNEGSIDVVNEVQVITPIKYGLLYNWYAATDVRKITSSDDWRLPTNDDDEQRLLNYINNIYNFDASNLKDKSSNYWNLVTQNTNDFNFSVRGSGIRNHLGVFSKLKESGFILIDSYDEMLQTYSPLEFTDASTSTYRENYNFLYGTSIRLVRNASIEEQLLLDGTYCDNYIGNDGREYKTIKIGVLIWTAEYSCETKYRNGDLIPEVTDNSAWAALTTGALCAYNNDWDNV